MSSPSESITDIDDSSFNKKRGRSQSVEPTQTQELEDQNDVNQVATETIALKKTKRDEDENTTSVSTIRRNMKDMTTADNALSQSQSTTTNESQDDEHMVASAEEEEEQVKKEKEEKKEETSKPNNAFAKFGGSNDDDWGEFAEEEEEVNVKKDVKKDDAPKYTFGASSGFGTKGWSASNQSIPSVTSKPTFGGFGSTSGFGAFKTSTQTTETTEAKTASVPLFGGFAKATSSPFASAAALSLNALTESSSTSTPSNETTTNVTAVVEKEPTDSNGSFGEGAKLKVPIQQQKEVKTGEEDEDTIYQTKGKLLVLDPTTGNWKERGVGTFRINMKEDTVKDIVQTRLVMRADSVFRVILNILLFEGMKVFIMQEKFVRFAGFETETKEDGSVETKLVSFALKLSNPTLAKEVYNQISACIPPPSASKA